MIIMIREKIRTAFQVCLILDLVLTSSTGIYADEIIDEEYIIQEIGLSAKSEKSQTLIDAFSDEIVEQHKDYIDEILSFELPKKEMKKYTALDAIKQYTTIYLSPKELYNLEDNVEKARTFGAEWIMPIYDIENNLVAKVKFAKGISLDLLESRDLSSEVKDNKELYENYVNQIKKEEGQWKVLSIEILGNVELEDENLFKPDILANMVKSADVKEISDIYILDIPQLRKKL